MEFKLQQLCLIRNANNQASKDDNQIIIITNKYLPIATMITFFQSSNSKLWHFRVAIVNSITSLQPSLTGISRRQQFQAVTIFDNFLIKKFLDSSYSPEGDNQTIILFSIVCLKLACKFDTQKDPKIQRIAQFYRHDGADKQMVDKCIILQAQILLLLDFQIPHQTFYEEFENATANINLSLKQAAYLLKFFKFGIQYSTELTLNPNYGQRICKKILFGCREDQHINNYLQTIIQWAKNFKNK